MMILQNIFASFAGFTGMWMLLNLCHCVTTFAEVSKLCNSTVVLPTCKFGTDVEPDCPPHFGADDYNRVTKHCCHDGVFHCYKSNASKVERFCLSSLQCQIGQYPSLVKEQVNICLQCSVCEPLTYEPQLPKKSEEYSDSLPVCSQIVTDCTSLGQTTVVPASNSHNNLCGCSLNYKLTSASLAKPQCNGTWQPDDACDCEYNPTQNNQTSDQASPSTVVFMSTTHPDHPNIVTQSVQGPSLCLFFLLFVIPVLILILFALYKKSKRFREKMQHVFCRRYTRAPVNDIELNAELSANHQ